jgi:thymidine kinase
MTAINNTGQITVIVGPMYSGKTTELLTYVEIYKLGNKPYKIFKPVIDDRYAVKEIRSHSGMCEKAIPLDHSQKALEYVSNEKAIFFDEVQFFDEGLSDVAKTLRKKGKDIICAGLDMSFKENPFMTTVKLMGLADKVIKKKAVCHECGEYKGVITYKLSGNESEIDVGGMEKYIAVCMDCYEKLRSKTD